jgi:hypothetical protein
MLINRIVLINMYLPISTYANFVNNAIQIMKQLHFIIIVQWSLRTPFSTDCCHYKYELLCARIFG